MNTSKLFSCVNCESILLNNISNIILVSSIPKLDHKTGNAEQSVTNQERIRITKINLRPLTSTYLRKSDSLLVVAER